MRRLLTAMLGFAILSPAAAQTIDELRQQLNEKQTEIDKLQRRLQILELQNQPNPDLPNDQSRALERALVREGASLLPSGTYEIEPSFGYSHMSNNVAN